jgi:hypothetical protein
MKRIERKKGWFEEWLDLSFMEKLITLAWCGMPYLLWMMIEDVIVLYRIPIVIVIWILLTLLCYWFGHFMSSGERDWN